MSCQRRICIVLLVGIPGSGKSYFRHFLEGFLDGNSESVLGYVQLSSMCYDDFSSVRTPNPNCSWKKDRLDLVKVVDEMIMFFKQPSFGSVDVHSFNERFPGVYLVNGIVEKPDSNLILIDDNMYYRSMRYEYFKLAKAHNVSFAQVYFEVEMQEALDRNNCRMDDKVPNSVIENMFRKIEPPCEKHDWETYSVKVQSYLCFQNSQVLNEIFSCFTKALENPFTSEQLDLAQKEADKLITNSNAIHQIDNALKQIVSLYIQSKIKESNKNELNEQSKLFSKKRLDLLKQIREGGIDLKIDLSSPVDTETIDSIQPLLSSLLLKNL